MSILRKITLPLVLIGIGYGSQTRGSHWVSMQCGALLGAFLFDDMKGPHHNHFLYSHSLSDALSHNVPKTLAKFYRRNRKGPCTYECTTPDANVRVEFIAHLDGGKRRHSIVEANYSHRFHETDPIFGAVAVELTEHTLPPSKPSSVKYEIESNLDQAERQLRALLSEYLQPRILEGFAHWAANSTESRGRFRGAEGIHSFLRLNKLVQKGVEPSFAETLMNHPEDALSLLMNVGSQYEYHLDPDQKAVTISNASTGVSLRFAKSGTRLTELQVSRTVGRVATNVTVRFADGRIEHIVSKFDETLEATKAAEALKKKQIAERREAERLASQGHYQRRENPEMSSTEPRQHVVFIVDENAMATTEGLKFMMAHFPRPHIISYRGEEFRIEEMHDEKILLIDPNGHSVKGSYQRHTVERDGQALEMMDMVLHIPQDSQINP